MHAHQLVSSFQTAANPQIVKRYAAKDYNGSKKLLLQTTCFSFYLMLLVSLPICLAAEPLLRLWLGIIPEYTVVFLQLIVIQGLFEVFDTSFYRALYAKGQLKENALISPMFGLVRFPIIYLLFKWGFSPVVLSWASLITYAILGLVVKPILLAKIVDYRWEDFVSVFVPCAVVVVAAVPFPLASLLFVENTSSDILSLILISLISIFSVSISVWFLGLTSSQRQQLREFAIQRLQISYRK
jgi:O-antigen/teichoic acid export membrane protein